MLVEGLWVVEVNAIGRWGAKDAAEPPTISNHRQKSRQNAGARI